MVTIVNFNSVFQIAFALNIVFFLFEASPLIEQNISRKLKKINELAEIKIEKTRNTYVFPISFFVGAHYFEYRLIMLGISTMLSLLALGFLIYDGFRPNAEISGLTMSLILFVLLVVTPLTSIFIYAKLDRWLTQAERGLKKEISNAIARDQNNSVK